LMHIVTFSQALKGNKNDARRLQKKAEHLIDSLEAVVPDASSVSDDLRLEIERLNKVLSGIAYGMEHLSQRKLFARIVHLDKYKDEVKILRENFDDAVRAFEMGCCLRTEISVGLLLSKVTDSKGTLVLRQANESEFVTVASKNNANERVVTRRLSTFIIFTCRLSVQVVG